MIIKDKRLQVRDQYMVVTTQCGIIQELCEANIHLLESDKFEANDGLLNVMGGATAYWMEVIGDIINNADAADDADDWMTPIYEGAHKMFPLSGLSKDTDHPEATCEQCGRKNITWFVQSDLWNKYARRPDGTDPMLCPCCFAANAELAGLTLSAWELVPTDYVDERNEKIETVPGVTL